MFEQFLEQDFVVEVQVDHQVAITARRLLRAHPGLKKPPDGIHLATAMLFNLDEMHTFDGENLLSLDGKVMRLDGRPSTIRKPPEPPQITLQLEGGGALADRTTVASATAPPSTH